MRLIDADVLKRHIDKLPALPDGNFAGNHSSLKALINMQPTIEPSTNCSEIPNSSDDTISRRAAIDAVIDEFKRSPTPAIRAKLRLEALPSAQPERKKGRWIDKSNGIEGAWNYCSVCGEQAIDLYDFCPNCGADMRGKE